MIRGKRLNPLAVLSDKPLELEGYGTIPAVTASVAGFKPDANYFGIFVHKDVPAPVKQTLDMIWKDVIAKSETMKKYATTNGAQFAPVSGDDAVKAAMPAIQTTAWQLHDAGKSKICARHDRHQEALIGYDRTTSERPRRHEDSPITCPLTASADWSGRSLAARSCTVHGRWTGWSLLKIPPATVPGLVPGLLGAGLIVFGLILLLRPTDYVPGTESFATDLPKEDTPVADSGFSWKRLILSWTICMTYGGLLLGRGVHYWILTACFLAAHILLLDDTDNVPARPDLHRIVLVAILAPVIATAVTLVFQYIFLVRLP